MTSRDAPPLILIVLIAATVAIFGVFLTRHSSTPSGTPGVRGYTSDRIERQDPAAMTLRRKATPAPEPTAAPDPEPTPEPTPEAAPAELEPIEKAMKEPPGTLSGWVSGENGIPIAGVEVRLEFTNLVKDGKPGPELKVLTGETGRFEFPAVPPGTWDVIAEHPSYAVAKTPGLEVQSERETEGVELVMEPALTVKGKARTTTGLNLEGVQLVLARQIVSVARADGEVVATEIPYRETRSNAKGEWQIDRAGPGSHILTASLRGFATERLEFDLAREGANELTVLLSPGANIGGIVRSAKGLPVPSTTITLTDPSDSKFKEEVTTKPDGSFIIGGLRAERTYSLTAKADNFAPAGPIAIPAGRLENLIILESGGAITGMVTSSETGQPLQGIILALESTVSGIPVDQTTSSRSDGTYEFPLLPSGTYNIRVRNDRLTCEPRLGVKVKIPKVTEGINFQLYPGKSITGVVADAATGERIGEATVNLTSSVGPQFLSSSSQKTTTDPGGSFTVENLPYGLYSLDATADGYLRYPGPGGTAEVRLLPDEKPEPVELFLARGGTVSGCVLDASGAPVGGAFVNLYNTPGAPVRINTSKLQATADDSGNFEIDGIPLDTDVYLTASATPLGGKIPLDAQGTADSASTALYGLAKGKSDPIILTQFLSTANVTIRLTIGGPLTVNVMDENGSALVDVDVSISHDEFSGDGTPAAWKGKTTSSGKYTFANVPAGVGTAYASKSGYIGSSTRFAVQDGSPSEVTLTLESGLSIEGYVVDDAGIPFQEGYVDARGESGARGSGRGSIDARGHFTIDGLGEGNFKLIAYATRQTPTGKHTVRREVTGVDVRTTEEVIQVPMNGRVDGVVVDQETDDPISGASITISGTYEVRSGSKASFKSSTSAKEPPGEFSFRSLPPGDYRLSISASNYLSTTLDGITVDSPGTFSVGRIALAQGAALTATVVAEDTEKPISGATVVLDPSGRSGKTNSKGVVRIASLPADVYTLQVSHSQYLSKTVKLVQVPEEGDVDAGTIKLDPGGRLVGRVTDDVSKPVKGALVTVRYVGEEWKRTARTNDGGRVTIEGLKPGTVLITVTAAFTRGNVTKSIEKTISSSAETTFDIQLVGNLVLEGGIFSNGRGDPINCSVDLYPLESDGSPVINGRIRATVTGSNYRATDLIEGDYLILVSASINGRVYQWDDRITLTYPGKTLPLIPPRARIAGRVLNADMTYALPDINIRLRSLSAPQSGVAALQAFWEYTTQSDELGYYEFECLRAGTYEIVATEVGSSDPLVLDILQLNDSNTTLSYDLIEQRD
ncbi:MAG: hypothetical protein PWP23_928 [Candidatus Sumerlaeota bacterium]|nr:hypothetical protein [Candidatus Sumerlaeota bacterium]